MDEPLAGAALDSFLTRVHEAANAIVRGDMERYADLTNHADDFTLLPPQGGPAARHEHRAQTLRASPAFITEGSAVLEHVETHAWDDTLVVAMIERQHGRYEGGPDQTLDLRVTHVYRREDNAWRLVHRHADPLVTSMTANQLHALMSE